MNQKIEEVLNVPVFVPPYPSDPGQALGNAIYGYITQTGANNNSLISKVKFDNFTYLGSEYSNKEILKILKALKKDFNIKFSHKRTIEFLEIFFSRHDFL